MMNNPALVSLTFDDGLRCQFERAVPILDQYGLPATFFLIANPLPWHENRNWRKIAWNDNDIQFLKSMTQRGHEIGSHSKSHKNPDGPEWLPDSDPKSETEDSKTLIEGWMGMEIPSFCYPFCKKPEPLKNAVKAAGYTQARAGATDAAYYSPQDSVDWFDVDCRTIREKENVGGWMRPDCWHILMFHGIGTWDDGWEPITVAEFTRQMTELAKHRDSGTVDVVTFKDGANRLRGK